MSSPSFVLDKGQDVHDGGYGAGLVEYHPKGTRPDVNKAE